MNRILVIRGGAIGDFILTLPAMKALRDAHPNTRIEILGYTHIAALAEKRFYAEAVRSIEYGALSSFFARNPELPAELREYFGSFDLILSYLYDPDQIFENNLRQCGARRILAGPAKIDNHAHATRQLARPITELGIPVSDFAAKIYPSPQDRQFADEFLRDCPHPIIAIHPGSGSEKKNWPLENWIALGHSLPGSLIVVSGEADEERIAKLKCEWKDRHVRFAENLALPKLGALLERTVFLGHDSGISHLAAAAGARCVLLFGPTDPEVWAPLSENVQIIRAASGRMEDVDLATVAQALMRIGIST